MTSSRNRLIRGIGLCLIFIGLAIGGIWLWQHRDAARSQVGNSPSEPGDSAIFDEMNLLIPANEIESLKREAIRGDNEAAERLAGHYSQSGETREEVHWLTLAANRGHCSSMSFLMDGAERNGDRRTASHWNDLLRQHACTWGKAYPEVANQNTASVPLWTE